MYKVLGTREFTRVVVGPINATPTRVGVCKGYYSHSSKELVQKKRVNNSGYRHETHICIIQNLSCFNSFCSNC